MPEIQKNVLLAPYTTFKIGGLAKYFVEAKNIDELKESCKWAKENPPAGGLPIFVLGGGSNVLISDKGFNGLVIKIVNCKLKIENCSIYAEAGLPLAKLVLESINSGLSGLEWAIGIPGTVGGAACGNSGAFGQDISNSLKSVDVFDCNNLTIKQFSNLDCDFAYRYSIFKRSPNLVILGADFLLEKGEKETVSQKLKDYAKQRQNSFSGNESAIWRSAGCFFKNIEWKRKDVNKEGLLKKFPELKQFSDKPKISTGFLIDFMGLKNKKIGGARVSEKHANFIVNSGNAKAEHVMMLASLIKQRIFNHYGFSLEEEVQLIGFD